MNLDQQIMKVGLIAETLDNPDMKEILHSTVKTLKDHRTILQGVAILQTGAAVYQTTMDAVLIQEAK